MNIFLVLGLMTSALAAPQYGPVDRGQSDAGPSRHPPEQQQRAPAAAAGPRCRTEYTTVWRTEYSETENEVCDTVYVNQCRTLYNKKCSNVPRQACATVNERQCTTVYNDVCQQKFRTEYEDYTETECNTEYKDDCEYQWEGEGAAKVWVPIAGTCKSNPYDTCADVQRQRERQVPYPVCNKVPEQKCVTVPKRKCRTINEQQCRDVPYQKCDQVPKQECNTIHKKVPNRISQRVPKKVCNGDGGHGSGYNNGGVDDDGFGSGSIAVRSDAEAIQFE